MRVVSLIKLLTFQSGSRSTEVHWSASGCRIISLLAFKRLNRKSLSPVPAVETPDQTLADKIGSYDKKRIDFETQNLYWVDGGQIACLAGIT